MRTRIGFVLACAAAFAVLSGSPRAPLGIGYLDGAVTAQDEAVYSHAAIAMVESGDWSTPMFMSRFFLYKPPLLYWLAGASAKVLGVSARSLRLPAMVAASLTAGLVFAWVWSEATCWRAAAALALLLLSPLFRNLGRRNMTDAVSMAAIVGAAWLLARRKAPEALAVCIAAGLLAKSVAGLIPLAIAVVWWLAIAERPAWTRFAVAGVLGLLVAAPWFVYQWETHRRWFEAEFIGVELLAYGTSASAPQASGEPALLFYGDRLWEKAMMVCVPFLAGLTAFARVLRQRRSSGAVALGAAVAVMAAAIFTYQYRNATYLLPLLPLVAIAAGVYAPWWAFALAGPIGAWSLAWGPGEDRSRDSGSARVALAETYCEMDRGNDLIAIGIDDNFAISTLPLARLRYAIRGAIADSAQVTLDFRRMGIVLPIAEFNDLAAARARYSPRLREWGLPSDEALGTVIHWDRGDDLAELVLGNPGSDFLFPPGMPPSAPSHRTVVGGNDGGTLLLSQRALPRARARTRTCRL